nr:MAG TPA: hypothetical protein [Caudoviricetes sp.]
MAYSPQERLFLLQQVLYLLKHRLLALRLNLIVSISLYILSYIKSA